MSCATCRDAISDRLDGHPVTADAGDVDAHLDGCADCRSFSADAHALRRALGLTVVDTRDADRIDTDAIARTAASVDRDLHGTVLRWLLGLTAALIVVLAVPDLVADGPGGRPLRQLGAFSISYAAGLLLVAARPARARTLLGVSIVLIVALVATTAIDVVRGDVPLAVDTSHLLELCSAWLLWLSSRPVPDPEAVGVGTSGPATTEGERRLRLVDPPGTGS